MIIKWILGRSVVRMQRRCDWNRVVFSDWLLYPQYCFSDLSSN